MVVRSGVSSLLPERLSVLALSSRFDGLLFWLFRLAVCLSFQYSLCRVVLMVEVAFSQLIDGTNFQYSLCRVVLMV